MGAPRGVSLSFDHGANLVTGARCAPGEFYMPEPADGKMAPHSTRFANCSLSLG
jgi:hypothetical protein